ncbi:MAG TPA: carboxypeptidase-like regulatory domain-containing protein [Terriglobales bacterium]|nr:carboxypeptidase-like regulatory domain-containing protein [Terriglobales bacterium]
MRRVPPAAWHGFVLLAVVLSAGAAHAALEDSVFVYDLFAGKPACAQIEQRLAALDLRPTVLLSVEQGPAFIPATPEGREQVACAVRALRRGKHHVKAMLLQDPGFLKDRSAAVQRVHAAATLPGIEGLLIDVEPYTDPDWDCGKPEVRRQIAAGYVDLLRTLRSVADPMPLEAAVAWWMPGMEGVPEFATPRLADAADGLYLMLYGDEGGPLVGATVADVAGRIPGSSEMLHRARVYFALARYESPSPEALNETIGGLRRLYGKTQGFRGTAVFHAGSRYNARRMRILSGVVTDAEGNPVPNAQLEMAGVTTRANICGQFLLRGMQRDSAELVVTAPGYRRVLQYVPLRPAGYQTEIPPIRLAIGPTFSERPQLRGGN